MCTSFCPKCGGDFLNDGPVCLGCLKKLGVYMPRTIEQHLDTINRMVNRAPDDDCERVVPMTQEEITEAAERISARMQTCKHGDRDYRRPSRQVACRFGCPICDCVTNADIK